MIISSKFENEYTLQFKKRAWTDDETLTVLSLGFKFDEAMQVVSIDLRPIFEKALSMFLTTTMSQWMSSSMYRKDRIIVFEKIKSFFKARKNNHATVYYPLLGYKESVGKEMFSHQVEANIPMIYRQSTLLAYDMGTGKTLTAISLSEMLKCDRTLIVSPSLVKWNWFYDLTRNWGFNPLFFTILDANKSKCMPSWGERYVVINYESVKKYSGQLLKSPFQHIIIDECHYIKNEASNRSKALKEIVKKNPNAKITMLSGTPITNRVDDLYGYLHLVDHPLGKNKKRFKERYAKTATKGGRSKIVGVKNVEELRLRLANFMLRKRSDECLDLPPLNIQKLYFDIDPSDEYAQEVEQIRSVRAEMKDLTGKQLGQAKLKIKGNLHTLNRLNSYSKIGEVKKFVDMVIDDNNEKMIIFTWYQDTYNELSEYYKGRCVTVSGKVDSSKKQILIDKFRDDPNCKVFIAQTKAGGIGINLVNTRNVMFADIPFTPDWIEQPYKRIHRPGQTRTCNIYFTIARDTIDEQLYSLVAEKAGDINEIVDKDKEGVIDYHDIQEELLKELLNK